MENIIKSGSVYKFHKSVISRKSESWKKCDAKLVEAEDNGILIIECSTEKQSQNISLKNCTRVLEAGTRNSRDNVIELLLEKKVVQLGFDTREEAQDWQHVLSQYSKDCLSSQSNTSSNVSWSPSSAHRTVGATPQTDTAESMEYNVAYELDSKIPPLDVTVRNSPLAEKLNLRGKFFLIIESEKLTIYSAENRNISYSWEYKTIRKYGRDKKSFSMEVGRRSPHGPGVLVFNTIYGNDIFHRVQRNTVAINSRPQVVAAVAPSTTDAQARTKVRQDSPKTSRSRYKADASRVNGAAKQSGPQSHTSLARATSVPLESEYSTIEDSRHSSNTGRGRKPASKPSPEIEYCKAEELKGDAWKKHGRMEPNIHNEIYFKGHPDASQKPPVQQKPPHLNPDASQLYGQVTRSKSKKSAPQQLPIDDSGVYSSLDQGYSHPHHPPPHPQQPQYDAESAYDHLSRPTSSPAKLASSQAQQFSSHVEPIPMVDEASEYDHLQRKLPTHSKPNHRQVEESVYNVLERPGSSGDNGEKLFDLVDDGSGYMTNAQAKAIIPPENEYDLAELPHFQ